MKSLFLSLLFLLATHSLSACINPGDPRYAEILARKHLDDFLDLIDNAPKIENADVEATLQELTLKHPDSSTDFHTNATIQLNAPPAPSIQGVDTNNFHIDSDLQELAGQIDSNPNFWQDRADKLREAASGKEPLFAVSNEYAVALIFTGEYQEAIKTLKKQEKRYPGKYETATNLGTAYELTGNLKSAKKWIDEGQKRNSNSHGGSEWIHSAILDAKIALSKKPSWLLNHYVSTPELDWSDKNRRQKTKDAILIQLSERLVFVKAPDPIVSSLFYELGSIYEHEDTAQTAEVFYHKSLEFGDIRRSEIEQHRKQRDFKTSYLRLIETARSEILREALRIASEKPDEECCRTVRDYGQYLSQFGDLTTASVESITYQNPKFWKALLQMSPTNQLLDSMLVSLFVQAGELDKARRITSTLAPFTFGKNIESNFGTDSMILLTGELDDFYETQSIRIQSGIQLHDSGKREDAIRIYKTVTDVFPKSVWANWEILLSSEQFLQDSAAQKNRDVMRKIQALDPLFMMGGTYSGSEEIGKMLLRMELRNLGSKGLSFEAYYYKYAETALLLEQYGLAALLYWKAIPVIDHPSLSQRELMGRFLHCMEALGHAEIVSIFDPSLSDEITKAQDFVDSVYSKFASR